MASRPAPETDDATRLVEAALRGRIEEVRELLAAGVPVEARNRHGTTPLVAAAIGGHADIARLLLESGAAVEPHKEAGWSATRHLMDRPDKPGRAEVAQLLLDYGADFTRGEAADSFLVKVIRARKWDLAIRLVEHGVPTAGFSNRARLIEAIAAQDHELLVAILDRSPRRGPAAPLCLAIVRDDADLFADLLDDGLADEPCKKSLPLIAAASLGRLPELVALLEHGAEVNRVSRDGETALTKAAKYNQVEAARLLIEHGADVNLTGFAPDGEALEAAESTPLTAAASHGQVEMVDLLLAAGTDVNLASSKGGTPLKAATFHNHRALARHLMAAGANFAGSSSESLQFLMTDQACRAGIVDRLLADGADPALPDGAGTPPLVAIAECSGGTGSIRKLLDAGVDIESRDATGRTPLIAAAGHAGPEVVEFLLERGADLEAVDERGRTALAVSADAGPGNAATTETLIARGANLDHRDHDGATPLMLAAAASDHKQIEILVDAGARLDARDAAGRTAAVYFRDFVSWRPRKRLLETEDGPLRVTDHWFHGCAARKRIYSDRKAATCHREEQFLSLYLTIYRVPSGAEPAAFLRGLDPRAKLFELPKPEGAGAFLAATVPLGDDGDAVAISTLVRLPTRMVQLELNGDDETATLAGWILAGFAQGLERESG